MAQGCLWDTARSRKDDTIIRRSAETAMEIAARECCNIPRLLEVRVPCGARTR